jgi:hypothetical protein
VEAVCEKLVEVLSILSCVERSQVVQPRSELNDALFYVSEDLSSFADMTRLDRSPDLIDVEVLRGALARWKTVRPTQH